MFGGAAPEGTEAGDADAGVSSSADDASASYGPPRLGLPPAAAQSEQVGPSRSQGSDARDAVLAGDNSPMFSEEPAPSDPLTLGGQVYLRAQGAAYEHTEPQHWGVSAPALLDMFLDARPNDRVRGFALGRMSYDPLLPAVSNSLGGSALSGNSGTAGSTSISPIFGGATNAPRVQLDQLWLRFDIGHNLFVTAGRQHVRWGTARFWTPGDFLHVRKRNPLDVFDVRTGTTMLKVHLPIESQAWNFYAYGITENDRGRADFTTPAGALRGEFVLGQLELGLGVFGRARTRAKFEADLSFGLGDIDFYAEAAVVDGRAIDRVGYAPGAAPPPPMETKINTAGLPPELQEAADAFNVAVEQARQLTAQARQIDQAQREVDARYPVYRTPGYRPQIVVGANYTRKYTDTDTFTIGLEYFYNGLGYDNPDVYTGLILPHATALQNPASFFYFGRHYGALFISFPAPFKLDLHTFTLSTLGNLSDQSFTSRFDYSLVLLTHLRFEAYASVAYGARGEFRFKLANLPSLNSAQLGLPNPTVVTLGVGLRLAI
jgi:hypothetical protein